MSPGGTLYTIRVCFMLVLFWLKVGNPNFSVLVVEIFKKIVKIVSPTIFKRKFNIKQTLVELSRRADQALSLSMFVFIWVLRNFVVFFGLSSTKENNLQGLNPFLSWLTLVYTQPLLDILMYRLVSSGVEQKPLVTLFLPTKVGQIFSTNKKVKN